MATGGADVVRGHGKNGGGERDETHDRGDGLDSWLREPPVLAADSPEQLVQAATQAAREGDVDGFLASMSTGTQKALTRTGNHPNETAGGPAELPGPLWTNDSARVIGSSRPRLPWTASRSSPSS